jgi:hypothetical protein
MTAHVIAEVAVKDKERSSISRTREINWPSRNDPYPVAARRLARLKKIAASKVSVPITV